MSHHHTSITCKNCGNHFSGKYCNNCGEKVYEEHDKSIMHFFEEGFHFITHVEGTLLTTIKTIFTKPGKLSLDYCNGIRKKYFKPIPLYLLLVVLYLLFPALEGLNMRLEFYPTQKYYGSYAKEKILEKAAETGYTKPQLIEKFHQKSEKVSKFMLLVLIPFTAIFFYLLTFWKRKYFFDDMVLAAELNSFYLMWGFLVMPIILAGVMSLYKAIFHTLPPIGDAVLGIIIYTVFSIYCIRAFKRFYGFSWWGSIGLMLLFFVAHQFIVYTLYKFLLFVTVINQIH
jgi:hypothetical protein